MRNIPVLIRLILNFFISNQSMILMFLFGGKPYENMEVLGYTMYRGIGLLML